MRTCKYCNKVLENTDNNYYVFCSDICWHRYNEEINNKTTKCEFCGKEFKVPIRKYGTYHIRHFCSDECSKLAYREKTKCKTVTCLCCNKEFKIYRDAITGRFPRVTDQVCDSCKQDYEKVRYKQRVCRNCGKQFDVDYTYNSAFCSQECYRQYNNKESYASIIPKGTCEFCGKFFDLPQDKNGRYNKDKKFCSDACATKQYYKEHPMPDRFCHTCGKKLIFIPGGNRSKQL